MLAVKYFRLLVIIIVAKKKTEDVKLMIFNSLIVYVIELMLYNFPSLRRD
jgi:hypothetical protein